MHHAKAVLIKGNVISHNMFLLMRMSNCLHTKFISNISSTFQKIPISSSFLNWYLSRFCQWFDMVECHNKSQNDSRLTSF